MRVSVLKQPVLVLFCLLFVLVAGGCKEKNQYVAPPPPSVSVMEPVKKEVVAYYEFTGTTQAVASVDIRARVQGFLESVRFKEGTIVKKGDLLYIIDPKPFQAVVDKADGDLAARKAQLDKAEVEYQRQQRMMKENATSERELNNAKAARDSAKAEVAVAVAGLETAQINLGYTTIRAPLSGKIGRSLVDPGNLVGAGEFTLLSTIKQYDPVYAYFTLNEQDMLWVMKRYRHKQSLERKPESIPVYMGLQNEEGYPHQGEIDYEDLGVDPTTGTMLLRGIFPNPFPHVIVPGLFARLRAAVDRHADALLVPERALGVDQQGKYVLVVNKENVVESRPVKTGVLEGGLREIEEGVKADDRVIVDGLQRVRPGGKATPTVEPVTPAGAQTGN